MAGQSDPQLSLFSAEEVSLSLCVCFNFLHIIWITFFVFGSDWKKFIVQVEFIAEDEMVEIVPNLRMDALNFVCVILFPTLPFPFYSYEINCIAYNLLIYVSVVLIQLTGGFWSFLPTTSYSGPTLACGGVEEEREVHYSTASVDDSR